MAVYYLHFLVCIYLKDFIYILRSSDIDCRYGNHYMGVYCYAYHLILFPPTLSGLKKMLKLCEYYALKHAIFLMPLKVNFFISHQTQSVCQKILF